MADAADATPAAAAHAAAASAAPSPSQPPPAAAAAEPASSKRAHSDSSDIETEDAKRARLDKERGTDVAGAASSAPAAAASVSTADSPMPSAAASAASSADADTRPPSVHYTPIALIPPQFVPESWTVTFPEAEAEAAPAEPPAAAAAAAGQEEAKDQPAAAASDAAVAPPQPPAARAHPPSLLVTRVSSAPLMLRVGGFLTPEECAEVLRLAYEPDAPVWKPYRNITYKPTHDEKTGEVVAQKFEVGYSEAATLYQLDYGHYPAIHPLIGRFADRVARIVNSTKDYSSNMRRLLRYKPGQKFELHADDYDRIKPLHRGKRLLTCLIYVHTEPTETGGGTVFPLLDDGPYRSPPTSGSLLIFRNFDPATGKFDPRCQHYAETTTKGSKYAINLYFVEKEGMWWH